MNYAFNKHYLERYLRFIRTRKPSNGYVERHHIYPRSMFPQLANDEDNLISLTAREHFIAHWMLHKAFGEKMTMAFMYMKTGPAERYWNINSKSYEKLRKAFGMVISRAKTGVQLSEAVRKKMSAVKIGVPLSESHRANIGAGNKGKLVSKETCQRISDAKKGITPNRVVTDEYRALMKRPKAKVACSCCGLLVAVHMVNRWHNDNCKQQKETK